jgi:hypothetical protein
MKKTLEIAAALAVRNSLVATPKVCTGAHRCKSSGPLCVLKLALMLTTLASTPGFAEEALEAAFGPEPTVRMHNSTFSPGENHNYRWHAGDLGQQLGHVSHRGGFDPRLPIENPRQRRHILVHLHDRG